MPSPHAHPRPQDRATLLAMLGVRNSQPEAAFDAVVQMAVEALGLPTALLSFMDDETVWVKARVNWPMGTLPEQFSLCKAIHSPQDILAVEDVQADPQYAGNPLVEASPQAHSYTGVPVVFDGEVIGTLSVIDSRPRLLDPAELRLLRGLCTVVTGLLESRLAHWRLRQEQARSLDFARISGDWLWETDAQHRYVWLGGNNFERKTGLAPETFIGRPTIDGTVLDFLGRPVDPPTTFSDVLKRRLPFDHVFVLIRVNGRTLIVARAGRPLFAPTGEFTGFRGISREVGEQVRHHQALQAAFHEKAVAQQASEAKTRFLSQVSHEIRTPLNAVMGFSELMSLDLRHPLAPAQRERLDLVRTAASRLLALVNDMLDLGRAEQLPLATQLKPVPLQPVLKTATDFLALAAESRGIALQVQVPPGLAVLADERGLEQVLLNLMSNAVKYNRSGEPVTVSCERQPPFLALQIADRGIGLTEEQQAQLFQPFNRLGAQHGPVAGTGLGLVISKALAEAMGGALSLSSQPGEGTTATLRLKLA